MLDPIVIKLAKEYFGFIEDDHLQTFNPIQQNTKSSTHQFPFTASQLASILTITTEPKPASTNSIIRINHAQARGSIIPKSGNPNSSLPLLYLALGTHSLLSALPEIIHRTSSSSSPWLQLRTRTSAEANQSTRRLCR
ncbi:hypothetical protein M0R45_020316 [Rubus argutus]|uniref:Uncharacterized protein n=1 Tax=Rubus argutus TaxID=59490 RepID=A0AAW1XBD7_RUBAR